MRNAKKLELVLAVAVFAMSFMACKKDNKATDTPTPTQAATNAPTQETTPTPTPRDCKGIEVTLLDWWSNPETWRTPNNQYQTVFFDMLSDAEETYNFKFTRKNAEYGWGDQYIESTTLSITNNKPDGQIITMDNRWIASLLSNGQFTDVSKV
ncbi:MAG: hypothetical protein J6P36_03945, partial [Lachnospiraceae bacterium]|nr:hypothetical protein [Lachnospiraceae bacterium]